MRKFKSILVSAVFTTGIFGAVLYTGCKNKCGSYVCNNGGTCTSNKCVCPTGYSGNSCENSWSSKFLGTFNCYEDCTTAKWQSSVTVGAANGGYTIAISNFGNSNKSYDATVDSTVNITIAPALDSTGISATGTLIQANGAPDTIKLYYFTVTAAGPSGPYCHMTMIKQ